MKKKKIPIIYENFVMIKDVQFKKKVNTEFFGVDIPVKTKSEENLPELPEDEPQEDIQEEQKKDSEIQHFADPFFVTEAQPGVEGQQAQQEEERIIPKNIYELQLDEIMHPNKLDYHQF